MTVSTMDQLLASLPAFGIPLHKAAFSPQAAGCWTSLWTTGGTPGAGANASSGVAGDVPVDSTAGAFPFTNPVAPALTYLSRLNSLGTVLGTLLLYDRLWQNSGLSPTLLTAQTVNSVALTRPDANGAAVEAWFQTFTTLGAGSTPSTLSYTDQDGNAGNTATLTNFASVSTAGRTFVYALAAGDTGVRSIQSYTNGATMTSGTFGLLLRRFVAVNHIPLAGLGIQADAISALGLPRIYDDACLELIWQASATTALTVSGNLALAQG